jgi:hypothetical protein
MYSKKFIACFVATMDPKQKGCNINKAAFYSFLVRQRFLRIG